MNSESRTKSGLTLMEMTVVVATIAVLGVLGLPAMRGLLNSLESQGSAKTLINGALASARAIAAKEQRYAGVRFQKIYDPNVSLEDASQYMIFIVYNIRTKTTLADGFFHAAEGLQPIKLPDSAGVMDLKLGSTTENIDDNDRINDDWEITDTSAFSIIFSPSGKLVIHKVQIENKDGERDFPSYGDSFDDIFNKKAEVEAGMAMFYQDDYSSDGLDDEPSRNKFIIYDRIKFKRLDEDFRWDDYLEDLADSMIYINPYTGTMIE